jgi:hypothetical protein
MLLLVLLLPRQPVLVLLDKPLLEFKPILLRYLQLSEPLPRILLFSSSKSDKEC